MGIILSAYLPLWNVPVEWLNEQILSCKLKKKDFTNGLYIIENKNAVIETLLSLEENLCPLIFLGGPISLLAYHLLKLNEYGIVIFRANM